jgi:hypothetical protein
MSNEKIDPKDYSRISTRVLNQLIKKRTKQIETNEDGKAANRNHSPKSLGQLKYELEQMLNALMERSMTKVTSDPKDSI